MLEKRKEVVDIIAECCSKLSELRCANDSGDKGEGVPAQRKMSVDEVKECVEFFEDMLLYELEYKGAMRASVLAALLFSKCKIGSEMGLGFLSVPRGGKNEKN